ncbi:MAG: TetR/AcrR family transcriptional regulator [Ilumatobacteraceae bacterium]|jgi:AcrR family transcriptional regulator|nr:TetR/AcrR family transcriptional regulator [Ilumatobacteraceae bacterium]
MAIVNLMSSATIHKLDGRHERVRKGKEAAINAIIAMVAEGRVNLTAADIAARAGISERTFTRYFDSIGDLIELSLQQIEPHIKHMLTLEVPSGDLSSRIKTLVSLRVSLIRKYGPLVEAVDQLSSNWAVAKEVMRERDRVLEVQFQRWFSGERTKMNEDRFAAIGIFLSYDSLRQLVFALGSRTEHVVTTLVSEMFVTKSR